MKNLHRVIIVRCFNLDTSVFKFVKGAEMSGSQGEVTDTSVKLADTAMDIAMERNIC